MQFLIHIHGKSAHIFLTVNTEWQYLKSLLYPSYFWSIPLVMIWIIHKRLNILYKTWFEVCFINHTSTDHSIKKKGVTVVMHNFFYLRWFYSTKSLVLYEDSQLPVHLIGLHTTPAPNLTCLIHILLFWWSRWITQYKKLAIDDCIQIQIAI